VRKYIKARVPSDFGYASLVPQRFLRELQQKEWVVVKKKMFPGYVLVGTDNIKELYGMICENEKIFKFLEADKVYSEVQYDEIEHLLKMCNNVGLIGESEIYVSDGKVFVKSGPLLNFDGIVGEVIKHRKRSAIRFQFNGECRFIQLCTNVLEASSDADYAGLKEIAIERKL
jgi:transcriptional antiterminator NusG